MSGSAARIDRTQGCSEASTASSLGLGGSLGFSVERESSRSPANQDAFRMTFIRSIFFCRAMIP